MKLNSGWFDAILIAVGLSTMLMVMGFPSQAAPQERKVSVLPSELPAVIRKAVEEAFPKGQIIGIQKEVEGENPGQYDVDMRSGAKEYEVEIHPEGEVIEIKGRMPETTAPDRERGKKWTEFFDQDNRTFSSIGRNRFFILEPGHQLVLESRKEKVVIPVLDKTKKIGGVETRIVEEREEKNGELVEVSRNFFAICKEHGDVFYFGEEVDDYKGGKIVNHSGAWRADEKNSRAGITAVRSKVMDKWQLCVMAESVRQQAEGRSVKNRIFSISGILKGGHVLGLG